MVVDGLKHIVDSGLAKRYVVFESDDWGSQRMPSADARNSLIRKGIISGSSPYDSESLESASDIEALVNVLAAFTDATGNNPVFTCFCNPANPDFDAIRNSGFQTYQYESVWETLERRGDRPQVEAIWSSACKEGYLVPEYHGREHLQVRMWMSSLRTGGAARTAFDHHFYSVGVDGLPDILGAFRAAYFFSDEKEVDQLGEIIEDGAKLFNNVYGCKADIFCPPNNVFHPFLYPAVKNAGCSSIILALRSKQPDGKGAGRQELRVSNEPYPGLKAARRNTVFEPVMNAGVAHALKGIESAFTWGVPAVISTHRVNYLGGIDPSARSKGLRSLQTLLSEILERWPDASFITSREMATKRASNQRLIPGSS